MPVEITERWSDSGYKRGESARRGFDITGATSFEDARTALAAPPWSITKDSEYVDDARLKADEPDIGPLGPRAYRAAVNYIRRQPGDDPNDPLDRRTRIRVQFAETSEIFDRDADNVPVLNSAQSPWETDETIDVAELWVTYIRNVSSYSVTNALEFMNRTNNATFNFPNVGTVTEGQALCKGIHVIDEFTNENSYVTTETRFKLRKDGWRTRKLDAGYEGWYSEAGVQRGNITIAPHGTSDTPARAVLLDGTGRPLNINTFKVMGKFPVSPTRQLPADYLETTADGVFLKFKKFLPISFAGLNLT